MKSQNVLLIMSEASNFSFNTSLNDEFAAHFKRKYPYSEIFYEYLDIDKLQASNYNSLQALLNYKYANTGIDAVVYQGLSAYQLLNQNNTFQAQAAQFLLRYTHEQDLRVPSTKQTKSLVANSVNDSGSNGHYELLVKEDYDILISNALVLSNASKVFVVLKSGNNKLTNVQELKEKLSTSHNADKIELLNFTTATSLSQTVNRFKGKALVVLTPFEIRVNNIKYNPKETANYLAARMKAPVFVHWDSTIDEHVLGGYVISTDLIAKQLVYAITDFREKRMVGFNEENIYRHVYNAALLKQFKLTPSSPPQNTLITHQLDKPLTRFFNEFMVFASAACTLLLILTLTLLYLVKLRKQRNELHACEQEIRSSNEGLKIAANSSAIGLWEYIVDSDTLVWDEWMFRHHGITAQTFTPTKQNWLNIIRSSQRDAIKTGFYLAITKGSSLYSDYEVTVGKGRTRFLQINAEAIVDANNEPIKLVGTVVDITEQATLQHMLQSERNKLTNVSRAKSQFIASTSHEIRNPMNVIIGSAESLENTDLGPRQQQHVANIKHHSSRLVYMVNDILDLSKIETGSFKIRKHDFYLSPFVQRILASFEQSVSTKRLKLKVNLASDLPTIVHSDPRRIKQVIFNVIDNAIKYTDAGYVEIKLDWLSDTTSTDGSRGLLSFSVIDTGMGIAPENQHAIFEKHDQSHAQTYQQYRDSGLGLHASKEIAKLLHGSLEVESKVEQGSCFTFSLPVIAIEPVAGSASANSLAQVPSMLNKQVLVVDDVSTNRIIVAQMLADSGATILFAENGEVAVEKAKHQRFDFIFMDILMPIMDGLEATNVIRNDASSASRNAIIISISAQALDIDEDLRTNAGMNDYLPKPIDKEALFASVYKFQSAS
jgi:signal transduction histidine kinase/ActR/RegA family two-component response regulator